MNTDGSGERKLTRAAMEYPVLVAHGRKIAFTSG